MVDAYPREFRDDIVRVARQHQAPINQIAKEFGVRQFIDLRPAQTQYVRNFDNVK